MSARSDVNAFSFDSYATPSFAGPRGDTSFHLARTIIFPKSNRKIERASQNYYNALCLNPQFRALIKLLREKCPRSFWKKKNSLENFREIRQAWAPPPMLFSEVEWERPELEMWVASLVQHWNPEREPLPPSEKVVGFLHLTPWTLVFDELFYRKRQIASGWNRTPQRAILILTPHTSINDGQQAATRAVEMLQPVQKSRGGRPGLTFTDHLALQKEFEAHGLPKPQQREQVCRSVVEKMEKIGRTMSLSTVKRKYREWLRSKGINVKLYHHD